MARASAVQMAFPRFESVTERRPAKFAEMPKVDDPELEKAQVALERMKEKRRIRSLKMELALAESEQQTDALLEEQRQAHKRALADPQVDELLRLRKAGASIQEALARIEGNRRPAKPVNNREDD